HSDWLKLPLQAKNVRVPQFSSNSHYSPLATRCHRAKTGRGSPGAGKTVVLADRAQTLSPSLPRESGRTTGAGSQPAPVGWAGLSGAVAADRLVCRSPPAGTAVAPRANFSSAERDLAATIPTGSHPPPKSSCRPTDGGGTIHEAVQTTRAGLGQRCEHGRAT